MSILRLAFPLELKSKIDALPVFAHFFIYREKIGKLYGISGLVNGVRNLNGACPVKYIEDVEHSEFNRGLPCGMQLCCPPIGGFHWGG